MKFFFQGQNFLKSLANIGKKLLQDFFSHLLSQLAKLAASKLVLNLASGGLFSGFGDVVGKLVASIQSSNSIDIGGISDRLDQLNYSFVNMASGFDNLSESISNFSPVIELDGQVVGQAALDFAKDSELMSF